VGIYSLLRATLERLMDTFYITKIYMMRPINNINEGLGEWFCNATGIDDTTLSKDGSTFGAKDTIITKGYNDMPNLELILREHNKKLWEQEHR
jgi:hypothetical protein